MSVLVGLRSQHPLCLPISYRTSCELVRVPMRIVNFLHQSACSSRVDATSSNPHKSPTFASTLPIARGYLGAPIPTCLRVRGSATHHGQAAGLPRREHRAGFDHHDCRVRGYAGVLWHGYRVAVDASLFRRDLQTTCRRTGRQCVFVPSTGSRSALHWASS
jgi:hypothetical protein